MCVNGSISIFFCWMNHKANIKTGFSGYINSSDLKETISCFPSQEDGHLEEKTRATSTTQGTAATGGARDEEKGGQKGKPERADSVDKGVDSMVAHVWQL